MHPYLKSCDICQESHDSLVALISEHRDVATVCFDKIATLTQINADDFLHFLVTRLPIQHGGGANNFIAKLEIYDEKTT